MTERLDDIAASLFHAAREERPSAEAKRRVLELASARRLPSRRRLVTGAVVLGIAAGIVLFVTTSKPTSEPPLALSPEPTRLAEPVRNPLPSAPPASAPSPAPAPSVVTPPRNAAPAPSSSAAKPRLSDEVRALERARGEIRAGRPDAALRMLDDYARDMRGGVMTAEATLLRIEALSRAGRASEANARARRFVAANPHSSLSDRARGFFSRDTDNHERNVDSGETP